MYRNNNRVLTHKRHNFVLNHGALGDAICSLPALAKAGKWFGDAVDLRVWCGTWQHDLFAHLLAPYGKFTFMDFAKFPAKWQERREIRLTTDFGPVSYNAPAFDQHTRNRVNMVDFAYNFLLDARPESMEDRSYLTAAEPGPRTLADDYVVFPVGATSENKLFRASVMAPVMQWCRDRGYKIAITGTEKSHTHVNEGGVLKPVTMIAQTELLPKGLVDIDLREKTTLLELRSILAHARAVVGVDGGTLHLAGTTLAPIVFASGTTLPHHRYIARNSDPSFRIRYVGPRDLECTGCQSRWLLTTWDFRHCAYNDNACMSALHPDDFIDGLKELGL